MNHWLMKSEPDVFGITHLAESPKRTASWSGVRNYQVRNLLRDDFQKKDLAFFYHSSCPEPGVYGVMEVTSAAHPDTTQFDPKDEYYDAKATHAEPRWFAVDVTLKETFKHPVLLQELRDSPALKTLQTLRRGNRLSITPVTAKEWEAILKLAHVK
ncbi:MAG TPA: EVE domain-containing protein [Gammaproteobacteria bacterium]|jgi:predicted RNA-binding protein with PUA-like domain